MSGISPSGQRIHGMMVISAPRACRSPISYNAVSVLISACLTGVSFILVLACRSTDGLNPFARDGFRYVLRYICRYGEGT